MADRFEQKTAENVVIELVEAAVAAFGLTVKVRERYDISSGETVSQYLLYADEALLGDVLPIYNAHSYIDELDEDQELWWVEVNSSYMEDVTSWPITSAFDIEEIREEFLEYVETALSYICERND